MTIKEFTTAAKAADEDAAAIGEPITITVDGDEITFIPPTSGQLTLAMVGASEVSNNLERMAATINFFFSLLSDEDRIMFKQRLYDREDPFGPDEIGALTEMLMEEWSARPIKQPSDYSPSQRAGGQKSTPRRHRAAASTRSR